VSGTKVIALRPEPDDDWTPAELQAAARDAYLQAAAGGEAPTGAELGRRFGRSDRWGRDRIAEARAGSNGSRRAAVGDRVGSNGSHKSTDPVGIDSNGSQPVDTTVPDGTEPAARADAGGSGPAAVLSIGMEAAADDAVPATAGSRSSDPDGAWTRRVIRWITTAAVIVVAACAARSSYEHQRTVVEMAGEHRSAWYMPLSVDGMMLIASLNMLVRRWDGQRAGVLTWTALLLGGAASLAANIAAAEPTWIGRLVAAWSPICLIVSYELLMQQLPNRAPAAGVERRQP
jgi:hypothetical protein